MAKRQALSKKIRFEVFKKDKFTCQYCGKMAPDVILEVDHIIPVSKGGTNDLLNLITSCKECNIGKRDRLLSDDIVLQKQKEQLKELAERREQLQMLVEYREELKGLNQETIDFVAKEINSSVLGGKESLNDSGKECVKKWLSRFDVSLILDVIEIAKNNYIKYDKQCNVTDESFNKFLDIIPRIAFNKKNLTPENEVLHRKASYLTAVVKNRWPGLNDDDKSKVWRTIKTALKNGADYDEIYGVVSTETSFYYLINNVQSLVEK